MRPILLLLPLVATAACQPIETLTDGMPRAAAEPSRETRVETVAVTANRVTLRMTDGARCVGQRPEDVQSGWSGVTDNCGYELPYTVVFRTGGDPARFRIEAPGGAPITEDGSPGPRAEVFVTDVDGVRRLFVTGLSGNVRIERASPTAETPES